MKTGSRIPVVLASTSPRRADLMNQIGLVVQVQAPVSEEIARPGELPQKLVARLAREKAESIQELVVSNLGECLIIAADTIVVAPDGKKILGKPKSPKEARAMLKLLAGKTHLVYTGYCIFRAQESAKILKKRTKRNSDKNDHSLVRVVKSKVTMRKLNSATIERYVVTGEPLDKAGSYGAQGLGTALVERIDGSYTNVVGLPMAEIAADLEKFGVKLFSWLN